MIEKDENSEHPKEIVFKFRGISSVESGKIQSADRPIETAAFTKSGKEDSDKETSAKKHAPIITSIKELPASGGKIEKATLADITLIERNQHVPFPELNKKDSDLEKLVLDTAENKFPSHDQLPDTITAGNIEMYTNWISALTERETQHAERGAVLHIPKENGSIIFPSDPDIGEEDDAGLSVDWTLARNRAAFVPTLNIHSHPVDICHSSSMGDMGTLIAGWKKDNFTPTGMLVATSEHNYLMIKTQETPVVKDKWDVYAKAAKSYSYDDVLRFRRFGSSIGESMRSSEYWKLYNRAEEQSIGWERGFETYYQNFTEAMYLAEAYDLGFYRSNKDGVYKRFTREEVKEHMTDFLNTSLRNAWRR